MDVDDAGIATPTNEWMEAAQRAVDTDGILENGSAKRQKVCNPCNTLTALHLQTLHKNAHKKRESLQKVRVRVAQSYAKKKNEKEHPKGLLRLTSALPPKSLPNHCRVTAVALPSVSSGVHVIAAGDLHRFAGTAVLTDVCIAVVDQ